jgi:hypothetical protein
MNGRRVGTGLTIAMVICSVTACAASGNPTPGSPSKSPSATTSLGSPPLVATTSNPQRPPAAGVQSACPDLGGTIDTNHLCHAHTSGRDYTIDFSFPADYPDQLAITDYLRQLQDDFIKSVADTPERESPYQLDVTAKVFRSGTPASGTQSVVFASYSESGGAHPVTSYEAFNYDVGKRAPITFDTLFKPDTNPLAVLDPIVQREMDLHWRGNGSPAPQNTLGDKVYRNFAVTDDAVIFFISQGAWLPEVAGPQRVSVPRTDLRAMLA